MKYPIWIEKEPGSDYSVLVPDLPGCYSAGSTIAEAMDGAREAMLCHLEGILAHGEEIPTQQPIEEHQANPDYPGGVWAVVDVDLSTLEPGEKAQRINVTIPKRLLRIIDEAATRAGESRSGFLARAGLEAARHQA